MLLKMDIAFLLSTVLLVAYSFLALYDGVYLHLYKYRLQDHRESRFEHLTHTIRAILFSAILYTLFIRVDNSMLFFIGITLVFFDVIIMITDAYLEKDSREFMGGLPRWEYILHLLVNGFHFAAIAVLLVIKINLDEHNISLNKSFRTIRYFDVFKLISVNLLPGSILIALLHLLVYVPKFNFYFKKISIKCC